jgi:hypothetical protein
MPIVTMDGEQIVYITTTEAANEYAKAITDKVQGKEMVCYGLDAAWCRGDAENSTSLFQFSFPEGDAVILLHLQIIHKFPKINWNFQTLLLVDIRLVVMYLGLDSLECM